MIKFRLFLLAFFGASFILKGTKAQELTCQVDYYSVPVPPECKIIIDENGQKEKECTDIGSVARSVILSQGEEGEPSNNVLREPDFELGEFTLTGYCDCELRLYSKENFGGCYIRSEEIYDGTQDRDVADIWTRPRNPQSFVLDCFF